MIDWNKATPFWIYLGIAASKAIFKIYKADQEDQKLYWEYQVSKSEDEVQVIDNKNRNKNCYIAVEILDLANKIFLVDENLERRYIRYLFAARAVNVTRG